MNFRASIVFLLFTTLVFSQKKWTLQEAVDYAREHNLQILQSRLNTNLQENNLAQAKREKLPRVGGTISNNVNFGQSQDIFGKSSRNDNFNNNTNISGDVLLYNHGRLKKTVQKNELEVEASQYDVEKMGNDIALQVAQHYLTVLLNREVEKISRSAMDNAQRMYNRAKITTEVGTTPKTVLAEAAAALAREKQNVKTAEINTKSVRFSLALLLQLEDYESFDIVDADWSGQLPAPLLSAQEVIAKAYEGQPQIKAAQSRIKAAAKQTELVRTNFWPTVSATAGVGTFYYNSLVTNFTGTDYTTGLPISEKGFFTQYRNNFGQQIGVSASIPVFNKGLTKLQVEQAKINEEMAQNNWLLQKQEVLQNVQRAQFEAQNNYELYLAALEAEKSAALAQDFAEKSFAAGRSTIYDLNSARNNLANAQGNVAQAKYNYVFKLKMLDFYAGIPLNL